MKDSIDSCLKAGRACNDCYEAYGFVCFVAFLPWHGNRIDHFQIFRVT